MGGFRLAFVIFMLSSIICTDAKTKFSTDLSSCHADEFKCANGNCIDQSSVCDGLEDCELDDGDLSDEENCQNHKCTADQFKCPTTGSCIEIEFVCDDEEDCEDGGDEQDCENHKCRDGEFRCSDGYCIEQSEVCDGIEDCDEGADEKDC